MDPEYGTLNWFETMFEDAESGADKWGHQWKASQKFRYKKYISILKDIIPSNNKLMILDIGCGLGNFTNTIFSHDGRNSVIGTDISIKAVQQAHRTYPEIFFLRNSLPNICFKEKTFDIVLCCEVLYYLNKVERINGISEIRRIIQPEGNLFLSVVLDEGQRYFSEEEIFNDLSSEFSVRTYEYNYAKIYSKVETAFVRVLNILVFLRKVLAMPQEKFDQWYFSNPKKSGLIAYAYKISKRHPLINKMTVFSIKISEKLLLTLLSWEFPVIISFYFSKVFLGNKGKTHLFILVTPKK